MRVTVLLGRGAASAEASPLQWELDLFSVAAFSTDEYLRPPDLSVVLMSRLQCPRIRDRDREADALGEVRPYPLSDLPSLRGTAFHETPLTSCSMWSTTRGYGCAWEQLTRYVI